MKEMSPETRTLVAFLLSILVLAVFSRFYRPPQPPAPSKPAQSQSSGAPAPAASNTPPPAAAVPVVTHQAVVKASAEKTIAIDSPLYRAELSNRGGVLQAWKLKKYSDDQKPPHPLDLVNAQAARQLGGWPFSVLLQDPQLEARVNSALYQVSPGTDGLDAPAELSFEWSDGHLDVTKKMKFTRNYLVELEASVLLDGRPLPVAIAWRGGFGDTNVYQAAQQVLVFYRSAGKLSLLPYKKLGAPGHPEERFEQVGAMEYAGIEDQFFAAAFLPSGQGLDLWHWSDQREKLDEDGKTIQEPVAEMAAGASAAGPLSVRVYVGPKDLAELGKQQPPLDDLVQFGWFGFIAKPLFEVLKWIYRYVPNYGWAIVLLTVAINMALFPLKMQSWRSMRKMQRLAPQIEAIKQKYAKYSMRDPRKRQMNEETMELYKKEGINPASGCLPMLLQMPIMFALYRMLGGAIELRHAPWIGWIHDLSAHDPYYILPVVMTITMYLMSKMTPTPSADPMQQKMTQLMPVVFGIFFFRLSSGLNLYLFTGNLVGITQQYFLNRTEPLPAKGKSVKKQ